MGVTWFRVCFLLVIIYFVIFWWALSLLKLNQGYPFGVNRLFNNLIAQ